MEDGLKAGMAALVLGAALSALMHYSKKSNIAIFSPDELNKLVIRCIDKIENHQSTAINLADN